MDKMDKIPEAMRPAAEVFTKGANEVLEGLRSQGFSPQEITALTMGGRANSLIHQIGNGMLANVKTVEEAMAKLVMLDQLEECVFNLTVYAVRDDAKVEADPQGEAKRLSAIVTKVFTDLQEQVSKAINVYKASQTPDPTMAPAPGTVQ